MSDKEYGFGIVKYEDENQEVGYYECLTIAFGDGLNRINTLLWDDRVGISIFRDESLEKFSYMEYSEENPAPEMPQEKIFITFDNERSIDAMINQLNFIKESLINKKY